VALERFVTEDYHTGGEPFRIVVEGTPPLRGATVADRRAYAESAADVQRVRALLCSEPRGHADMYGCFVTEPDDPGARFGVLFWHKDGFSTACGHGTIALGRWAVDTGRVERLDEDTREVVIDVPSGRVTARVRFAGGDIEDVTFVSVPSWLQAREVPVRTARGETRADIAYGGAMYAVVPAAGLGLRVDPADYGELIATGRQIRDTLTAAGAAQHPADDRLSGIYGTIFTEQVTPPVRGADGTVRVHERNVTVFADGEVDRSPCGSGTAARVAQLADRGLLGARDVLVHDSIVGSSFRARIAGRTTAFGRAAVVPEVTGTAYPVARSEFFIDPRDPLIPGFVLR